MMCASCNRRFSARLTGTGSGHRCPHCGHHMARKRTQTELLAAQGSARTATVTRRQPSLPRVKFLEGNEP